MCSRLYFNKFDLYGILNDLHMPDKSKKLKKDSFFLLHLSEVSTMIYAKLEIFGSFKAEKTTVNTFCSIAENQKYNGHTKTLESAQLLYAARFQPEKLLTDGSVKQKKCVAFPTISTVFNAYFESP